jgi:hypothetical protein
MAHHSSNHRKQRRSRGLRLVNILQLNVSHKQNAQAQQEFPEEPDPEYRTRENLGERLVHFVLEVKTVFSPRFFACGTFSTFLYGNGSHSNRVTVTPDRAIVHAYPKRLQSELDNIINILCQWIGYFLVDFYMLAMLWYLKITPLMLGIRVKNSRKSQTRYEEISRDKYKAVFHFSQKKKRGWTKRDNKVASYP